MESTDRFVCVLLVKSNNGCCLEVPALVRFALSLQCLIKRTQTLHMNGFFKVH